MLITNSNLLTQLGFRDPSPTSGHAVLTSRRIQFASETRQAVPLSSHFLVNQFMARSATVNRKRRGGHRTGTDPVTAVRLPRNILGQIDRWRREHGAKTRSEALQRLVEQALGSDPERRTSRKAAAKASELAGREIDRLADPSATAEEQAKRKRRLIKGPREFRRARRDVRD
jgi:Arc/MetJ-type ribon-helix-helix transcriptional regulator